MTNEKTSFRWVVLSLAILVNMFVMGMTITCMPSLYGEISRDIPMTHTQWGTVWGISFLPMMIFTLIGGMVADRMGTRFIVGIAVVLTGILCVGRSFAQTYNHLLLLMFFMGICSSFLMPNLPKSLGYWFAPDELGLATGLLVAGVCMGSGSALLLSGVYFSPLMGGWRNVMWFYGIITIILGVAWLSIFRESHRGEQKAKETSQHFSFRSSFAAVIKVRDLWLLTLSRLCVFGSLIAVIGFLPELLVSRGMKPFLAHSSSSLLYYINAVGVIAIPVLSDKYGVRKIFIWPFGLLAAFMIISLGMVDGISCIVLCALIGLVVGFIPLMLTMPMEMPTIGSRYFGTALGFSLTIGNLGSFLAPIIGGKIIDATGTEFSAFLFWGALMLAGSLFILPMRETGSKMRPLSMNVS